MKNVKLYLATLITLTLALSSLRAAGDFDDAHRFIFYAVLEGCYEDGLSTEDVSQILLPGNKGQFAHFIYACPICTPTIHALETYRSRPPHFYGLKTPATTFGPGLETELRKQLYSEKPETRLTAINTLMQGWVSKRMSLLNLSDQGRAQLQSKLQEMRKKGNSYLKGAEASDPGAFKMSAFANVRQCAVCNGACSLKLQPDAGK